MIFYHYCTIYKFNSIIKSKQFWLADLTKSNDKNEVVQTFDVLWKDIRQQLLHSDIENVANVIDNMDTQFSIQPFTDVPFGTCFSAEGDLLSQWNEYADNKTGVSLGIDFEWFSGLKRDMPHPSSELENSIGFDRVIYYQQDIIDDFVKKFYKILSTDTSAKAWLTCMCNMRHYSAFIKDNSFRDEREFRIVYYPCEQHEYLQSNLRLSSLKSDPFNHFCLPWYASNTDKALKQIILAPNCDYDETEVIERLKAEFTEFDVEIKKSTIPYRTSNNR